ncbi:SIR2 family NAD-dependent protein deacylase [Marinobacter guineae]|uniref:SIR2 family NAD-dependent protein deacylase n=1 Tax=Marinobacter guineae TaxID=432303 RepID=UPI001475A4CD|nr:SIR2 family protein [Marinobacter guineae]
MITTNWDTFLEETFQKSKTFIGQDELIFGNPQGISEIYKIHGSATNPNSLILTEEDYKNFEDRNAYLASKLLTIFVEHPIIFLGYSLSDPNIQRIIKEIVRCIPSDKTDELRDRFIFVEYTPGQKPKLENSTYHVESTPIIIKQIKTESFEEIFSALTSLRRRFPAHILRQLKEQVYDLVIHNDPQGKLFVKDIDGTDEDRPKEVVFGVGAISKMQATGYKGLDRLDLIRDCVFNTNGYDPFSVVTDTLQKICKGNAYIPIFKYLKESNLVERNGKLKDPYNIYKGIADRFYVSPSQFRSKGYLENQANKLDIENTKLIEIERSEGPETMVKLAPYKSPDEIDLKYLKDFMKSHFEEYSEAKHMTSHFCKLACYLDYIENYYNIFKKPTN